MSTYELILERIEIVLESLMKSNDKSQYSNILNPLEVIEMIKE